MKLKTPIIMELIIGIFAHFVNLHQSILRTSTVDTDLSSQIQLALTAYILLARQLISVSVVDLLCNTSV